MIKSLFTGTSIWPKIVFSIALLTLLLCGLFYAYWTYSQNKIEGLVSEVASANLRTESAINQTKELNETLTNEMEKFRAFKDDLEAQQSRLNDLEYQNQSIRNDMQRLKDSVTTHNLKQNALMQHNYKEVVNAKSNEIVDKLREVTGSPKKEEIK